MKTIGGMIGRLFKRPAVAMLLAVALLLSGGMAKAFFFGPGFGMWPYIPQFGTKKGAVYARSVVPGPNGFPVYVEFDTQGQEVLEIGELTGELGNTQLISGNLYRSYIKQYQQLVTDNTEALTLSREDYLAQEFRNINDERVTKAPLASDTLTIVVRPRHQIFGTDADSLVLMQLPVQPTLTIADSIASLLLNKDGSIRHQTENNIGFRVGFFSNDEGNQNVTYGRGPDDSIHNPLAGIPIETSFVYRGGFSMTNEEGKYFMRFMLPPCPGFSFIYTTDAWAELKYKRFNPRMSQDIPYYMRRPGYDVCNGYSIYTAASFGVVASAMSPGFYNTDFPVDMMVLSGQAKLQGAGKAIPLGDQTLYDSSKADLERLAQSNYDFDGDGESDTTRLGRWVEKDEDGETVTVFEATSAEEAELQGVWLSSNSSDIDEEQPDLTRLADWSADFEDRALLSQISQDDLANTDIYVFRESNGQLVAERRGLTDNEYLNGVNEDEGKFFFTLHMLGRYEISYARGMEEFAQWQAKGRVNPALHQRESDHLRPGERVRIIAINRASGYMGSTITTLQAAGSRTLGGDDQISFKINDIPMSPPNLKIWAERTSTIDQGMTRGDIREQTIGNEGAGLADDETIAVYTEWLDPLGRPLPETLSDYGFTGRIARVIAENILEEGAGGAGQVSQFPIKPGKQLQVIRLPERLLSAQHLYIQVSGEPSGRHPDFSSSGAQEGILKYRPDRFVPFKVPVYDEDSSLLQEQAYKKAKNDQPEKTFEKPKPVYQWAYRPELQFSIYDLMVDEIRREDTDDNSQDVLKDDKPVLTSSDAFLKILYDLQTNANDPLEAYSYNGDRELVFALGEQELKATVSKGAGEHQKLEFDDLSALSGLEPEDYLSLRLYTNNDAGNILWEWAFEFLALDTRYAAYENQTEVTFYVSADNPQVPLQALLVGYASRDAEDKEPARLLWQVDGGGIISDGNLQSTQIYQDGGDLGIFPVDLTLPTQAGSQVIVKTKLLDRDTSARYKTFEVEAGEAKSISLKLDGAAHPLSSGILNVRANIRDQHGNAVSDGTPVSFKLNGSARIVSADDMTVAGVANVHITGSEFEEPNLTLVVQSGEAIANSKIEIPKLQVELPDFPDNIQPNSRTSVTARVVTGDGTPAANVPVSFNSTYGLFSEQRVFTNEQGEATTTLVSPPASREAKIVARTGFAGIASKTYQVVGNSPSEITTPDLMLVGDVQEENGSFNFIRYDGSTINYDFRTWDEIELTGVEGEQKTLQIGDLSDPNRAPIVAYIMNEFDRGVAPDATSLHNAEGKAIVIANDNPMGVGQSYRFFRYYEEDQPLTSTLQVSESPVFKLAGNTGFRLDAKPTEKGNVLVNAYQGTQKLSYDVHGRFVYSITTKDGVFEVSSDPVVQGQWHTVAVRYSDSELTLYVDGQLYTVPASGELVYDNDSGIKIGDNYVGLMNSLRFYDWSSQPLVTFENGSDTATVTLPESGKKVLRIKGTGQLNNLQAGSGIATQRVALSSPKSRYYISLLSSSAYRQLAETYIETGYPNKPPLQLAGGVTGQPLPLSWAISSAHAGFFDFTLEDIYSGLKSVAGFIIPFEEFSSVVTQLGYLVDGDDQFDPVELSLNALIVATVIPVAKPVQPVLKHLKPFVEKYGNKPIVKAIAGVVGDSIEHAIKNRNLDRLISILPYLIIVGEMFGEEGSLEAIEMMVNSVGSTEDLWAWIEFLNLPDEPWEGEGIPEIGLTDGDTATASDLPLSFFMQQAYAKGPGKAKRLKGAKLVKVLKEFAQKNSERLAIDPLLPSVVVKVVPKAMKSASAKDLRPYIFNARFLTAAAALAFKRGAERVTNFVRGRDDSRIKPAVILGTIAYLEYEMAEGQIARALRPKIQTLYGKSFLTVAANTRNSCSVQDKAYHGSLFHLTQIAAYQLSPQYTLKGIEEQTSIRLITSNDALYGKPFKRDYDLIVTDSDGKDIYVELKSYKQRATQRVWALEFEATRPER